MLGTCRAKLFLLCCWRQKKIKKGIEEEEGGNTRWSLKLLGRCCLSAPKIAEIKDSRRRRWRWWRCFCAVYLRSMLGKLSCGKHEIDKKVKIQLAYNYIKGSHNSLLRSGRKANHERYFLRFANGRRYAIHNKQQQQRRDIKLFSGTNKTALEKFCSILYGN